jgi:hypothetical protein
MKQDNDRLIEETSDVDIELLSKAFQMKSRRTLIESNPHFCKSIIQSILKQTGADMRDSQMPISS